MMVVAGVDVGAGTAKAVIFAGGEITSYAIQPVGYDSVEAARKTTEAACEKAGVSFRDLSKIVATGYSRGIIPFAKEARTEIMCHARGVNMLIPQARTVIDIGCQDSKLIRLDERGMVINFAMNDKCAAGTGRFIEVMAHTLGLTIKEVGPVALTSNNYCEISSTCTVFAETEIIAQRARGRAREDLIAGALRSVAKRVSIMAHSMELVKEVVFTGGVAKNTGVKQYLEEELGMNINVPEDPQIIGALGAALFANDEL
jgi:predicted CoA-substrate-specific enzyme activase